MEIRITDTKHGGSAVSEKKNYNVDIEYQIEDDDVFDFAGVQSIGHPAVETIAFGILFPWGVSPVMAGPYSEKPKDSPGIKLAAEMKAKYMVDCPIKDFGIPNTKLVESALLSTIVLMKGGLIPFVGCGWGRGRTGLFVALLIKVAHESTRRWWDFRTVDYVSKARAMYRPEAVETKAQEEFVRDFDVKRLAKIVRSYK